MHQGARPSFPACPQQWQCPAGEQGGEEWYAHGGFSMCLTDCFLSQLSIAPSVPVVSPNTDEFLDLLASSQSRRLDDQRASFSNLPGLRLTKNNNQSVLEHLMTNDKKEPDEDFFDILVKCQVSVHTFHLQNGQGSSGRIQILERLIVIRPLLFTCLHSEHHGTLLMLQVQFGIARMLLLLQGPAFQWEDRGQVCTLCQRQTEDDEGAMDGQ